MAVRFGRLGACLVLCLAVCVPAGIAAGFPSHAYAAEYAVGSLSTQAATQPAKSSAAKSSGYLKVSKYLIRAKVDTDDDIMTATVTATIKNKSKKPVKVLYFRNMAATLLKHARTAVGSTDFCRTKVLQVTNLTTKKKLRYSLRSKDKSVVKVKLGKKKLRPGKKMRIRIKVRTDIPQWDGRFGYHDLGKGKLYMLAWCFPYLADYRRGAWNLGPLSSTSENRFARATTAYDASISFPKKYKVAATGASKTKKGKTRVKAKGLRDFAVVASNMMKKKVSTVRGVRIVSWYLPGSRQGKWIAETLLPATDAVTYLNDHIGKCSFKEIDICPVFGTVAGPNYVDMEYPGLVTLRVDRYYYDNPWANEVGIETRSAYHEVAHQWFYGTVGNNEYAEPWLDEGISCFFDKWLMWQEPSETARYLARAAGQDVEAYLESRRSGFRSAMEASERGVSSVKLNRSVPAFESYFSTVYATTPWFLVQLQEEIGAYQLELILRDYYSTYYLKEADTQGFLNVVRRHAGSPQVEQLISKYF